MVYVDADADYFADVGALHIPITPVGAHMFFLHKTGCTVSIFSG